MIGRALVAISGPGARLSLVAVALVVLAAAAAHGLAGRRRPQPRAAT